MYRKEERPGVPLFHCMLSKLLLDVKRSVVL